MSLYGAMNVGISGVRAQDNKINIISDNIANVSTVGYKSTSTAFEALIVYDRDVAVYSPGGVLSSGKSNNGLSGAITRTGSSTDMAISGNGFFAVKDGPAASDIFYTRAGSFQEDENGNLVNTAGYFLQGWVLDAHGNLPTALSTDEVAAGTAISSLVTVNPNSQSIHSLPTTSIAPEAVLTASQAPYAGTPAYDPAEVTQNMSSGAIEPHYTIPVDVIDEQGGVHTVLMRFLKTAPNTWAVEVHPQTASEITSANPQLASGTLTFNGDGTLATISPGLSAPVTIPWSATGTAPNTISFNWGTAGPIFGTPNATVIGRTDGISQTDSLYSTNKITKDGIIGGILNNVSVTSDGYIVGNYSNGSSRRLYKVPIATFVDSNQLETLNANVFRPSINSSTPVFWQAGTDDVGNIAPSSLESSNADVSGQLTDLIVAQRSYQINTQTITTTDAMMQTLTQMLG